MLHIVRACVRAWVFARARSRVRAHVALLTKHAKRLRRILLSSVVCLAPLYFATLFHKRARFSEKVIEHKICFSLQLLSETFLILGIM